MYSTMNTNDTTGETQNILTTLRRTDYSELDEGIYHSDNASGANHAHARRVGTRPVAVSCAPAAAVVGGPVPASARGAARGAAGPAGRAATSPAAAAADERLVREGWLVCVGVGI